MKMHMPKQSGFSLVELVLAIGIFALIGSIIIGAFIYGRQATQQAGDRNRAAELNSESLEVVRNIANPNYSNLSSYVNGTTYYITVSGSQWQLTTTPTAIDNFTRTVVFADGPNGSRQATVSVSWKISQVRNGNVSAITYFANWRQPTAPANKSGLFVYANGGTTTDTLTYRQLLNDGTWTSPSNMPDIDASTTNRVARSVKLYSAKTGSAKMVLSRHFNGTTQYLYGTWWNGTAWGTPTLLAQWNSTTYLDVGNFSGDYTADGSFLAVYSDGSNTPKSRIFNGTTWGGSTSLGALGSSSNFPTNVVVKARPQTNEVMAAFLDFNFDTNSNYYSNGQWQGYVQHAVNSIGNNSKQIDFAWSPVDPTTGVLLHTSTPNDRSLRVRTFTANGTGNGSWNPVSNASNQPPGSVIGSLALGSRPTVASDFVACDKDQNTPPAIYCYKFSPGPSGFEDPANKLITTSTATGLQITFDLDYKALTTNIGMVAYSDGTSSAKLKLYDSAANSWSASPVISLPNASSIIQKTSIVSRPNTDEAMIVVADSSRNLYSVVVNGTNNTLYSSPSGKAWTTHNTSGPSNNAVWFDFGWDN